MCYRARNIRAVYNKILCIHYFITDFYESSCLHYIVIREMQGNTSAENFNLLLLWNALVVVVNRIRSFQNEHSHWLCVKKFNKPSSLERFLIDCRKTKPRQSKWPITTKERTNENSKQLTFYRRYMRENLGDQDTKGLCLCGPL